MDTVGEAADGECRHRHEYSGHSTALAAWSAGVCHQAHGADARQTLAGQSCVAIDRPELGVLQIYSGMTEAGRFTPRAGSRWAPVSRLERYRPATVLEFTAQVLELAGQFARRLRGTVTANSCGAKCGAKLTLVHRRLALTSIGKGTGEVRHVRRIGSEPVHMRVSGNNVIPPAPPEIQRKAPNGAFRPLGGRQMSTLLVAATQSASSGYQTCGDSIHLT